ncbi:hypothetical protein VCB98_08690 [Gammaproteobacteria bacterium AB-CW1]|uniref:Lipoprotein n=1 Tax=Natronospira elongata TaxID=3110268 RepID=A0AAP6JGW0_9GAMM|nr:hypothetical protein [Gammaproteobacteria bacterium AB-CW1]
MNRCLTAPGSIIAVCFMAACATGGDRLDGPVSVEQLLTDEEFEAAGLGALDQEELRALDSALTRALASGGEMDQATMRAWEQSEDYPFATFGLQDEHPAARRHDRMRTRLGRPLEDWDRGQRIHLDNDQVWQVVTPPPRSFGAPAPEETEVTVRRAAMNSFLMDIGDKHPAVRVRRVE